MAEEKVVPAEYLTPEGQYSLIRENLMTQKGYSPYCGSDKCLYSMPRTVFNGEQFACKCGWRSQFDEKFIGVYKKHWDIK